MREQDLIPYQTTSLYGGQRVLVLAPHPDDETFGCGGTLSLHSQHGDSVRVAFVTSGELGDWHGGQDREAHRMRREAEAEAALVLLGVAEWEWWRYPDRGVTTDGDFIARLTAAVRAFRATLLYVPSPLEIHPDHRAVAQAVRAALRGWPGELRVAFYEVGYALPLNTLVDISAVWAIKEQAIHAHASQRDGPANYLAVTQGLGRFRTLTLGPQVTAAEAFRVLPVATLESDALWRWQGLQEQRPVPARAPAVSVIVRTKDRPAFLREALASLVAQTFTNFEVIVVNDGGQDISAVVAAYPSLRLTVVQLTHNQGRGAAANAGITTAQGTFITYLDDDDLYYPPHIETLYTFLSQHDHFGAVYTDAFVARYCLNRDNQRYECVERRVESSQDFDPDWLFYQNYIPNLSLMHRRDGWERVGGFDATLALLEDWDFFIRLAQESPFFHLPRCTAEYRIRDDHTNLSLQKPWKSPAEILARIAIYQRYRQHRTVEAEVRLFDMLMEKLLHLRRQGEEKELLAQERDRALAAVQELRTALDVHAQEQQELKARMHARTHEARERAARLEGIYASTTWKLYRSYDLLVHHLFRRLYAGFTQWRTGMRAGDGGGKDKAGLSK